MTPGRFGGVPASQSSAMNVSCGRLRRLLLPIDLVRAIRELEQVVERADRFGQAQDEEPARIQGEVEHRQQPFLQRRRHVDQHVAARHQIDARERRIDRDVLPREDAEVAHALLNPVVPILLDEEPSQPLGTDFRLDALRIEAGARLVEEAGIAEVGREDLNRSLRLGRVEELQQGHRDRVRLLAGRAARHPDADRRSVGLAVDDRGEDLALEILEHLRDRGRSS